MRLGIHYTDIMAHFDALRTRGLALSRNFQHRIKLIFDCDSVALAVLNSRRYFVLVVLFVLGIALLKKIWLHAKALKVATISAPHKILLAFKH